MPRSRLNVALYLILVFASGILVGVVSYRLYATTSASANSSPQNLSEFRKRYLTGMREKVGASEQQIVEITRILDDTKREYDELTASEKPLRDKIQHDNIEQIRMVLNQTQRQAYDNWRAERERERASAAGKTKK